jgi:hypothetical protein
MFEFVALIVGVCVGVGWYLSRGHGPSAVGAVGSGLVLGVGVSWLAGEIAASPLFALFDAAQVAIAALATGWLLTARGTRGRRRGEDEV